MQNHREIGRCCSDQPPLCQFAVITWANEGNHSSTPPGHCGPIVPLYSQTIQACSQCGKAELNPDHHPQHNGPEGVYLTAWVTDQGIVLSPFFPHSISSSIHSIRSFLFLSNGHSHINTRGFFFSARSQRWPYHPGVFCLFVPQLKELNWAAAEGGLEGGEGS